MNKMSVNLDLILVVLTCLINVEAGKLNRLNVTKLDQAADTNDVCNTEGCKKAANIISRSLNTLVNPCDDFYEFACGGFISKMDVPRTSLGINSFSIIKELTFNQIKEILSEDIQNNEIKPFRMAKQFYKDCLDEDAIMSIGLAPITNKIKELGGWPVYDSNWNDDTFSWIDTVEKARKLGFSSNYILSFDIETNLLNSSSRSIYVSPPELALSPYSLKQGINDGRVALYYRMMVSTAVKLKVPLQKALIELASSLHFETQIAQIYPTPMDRKEDINKTFVSMTIAEAQKKFPHIEWMKFLRGMLNPTISLSESDVIVVAFPDFVTNLQQLLVSTSKKTLANYLIWRVLFFSLNSYLMVSTSPRWKNCAAITADKLNVAVASMYIRRFVNDKSKQLILEISSNIRESMKETLNKSEWIDGETKKNALDKIKAITENIAYPEIILNDKEIIKIYNGLEVESGQYYESLLSIKRFLTNFTISLLKKPVLKNDWLAYENPLIVNAFYALPENSIKIPVALLQWNVFSMHRPNYMNYGAIGFIVGHELSHAFDDQGSSFDKDGNYRDWWPENTRRKYDAKVQCFVEQYNKYTVAETGIHVNGRITQGENIADNEGIRQAYRAYEKWIQKNHQEQKLPGLNYTPKQLFWIGAANVWCSKYARIYLDRTMSEDLHAPDKVRIIGAFSNQRSFAKDFGCSEGSPMNPKEKCSLWD